MPSLAVEPSSSTPFEETVALTITNAENFKIFAAALINDEVFFLRLAGETTLRSGGVAFDNIPFDKTISLTGLDGLGNITVNSFDLSSSTEDHRTGDPL